MEQPLISFILPVFNNNNSIIPTLKSLINQKYNNKEIIIIDDSSTDNSIKLIQKYINKYTFIKVISEPALGKLHNLETALSKANGSLILFVETGKIYIDTMASYLVSEIDSSTDIIVSDYFCITEAEYYNHLEIIKKSPTEKFEICSGKNYVQKLTSPSEHSFENCISLWNKIIKKSVLDQIDFKKIANTFSLAKSIFLISNQITISNQFLICKILFDQYFVENCFSYHNLEKIQFLEEILLDSKKEKSKIKMYNCSLRLMSYLLTVRKQLSFYSLNINDKIQLRESIDKKFNSIYKFLIVKFPTKSEKYEEINETYRQVVKKEKFVSKYYYLYPNYVENYPE